MNRRISTVLCVLAVACGGCQFNVLGLSIAGGDGNPDLAVADPRAGTDLAAPPDLAVPPDLLPCVRLTDPLSAPSPDWVLKGNAAFDAKNGRLELTGTGFGESGTAFYKLPLATPGLDATFSIYIGDGSGADGMALVLAKAADVNALKPTGSGDALGYAGMDGWAIRFDTFGDVGDPGSNWVGLTKASDRSVVLSNTNPPSLACGCTRKVHLRATATHLLLAVDGAAQIDAELPQGTSLDGTWFLGFTAASGGFTDRHAVSGLDLIAGPAGVCF